MFVVALYVRMIEQGRMSVDDVPQRWRDAVVAALYPVEDEENDAEGSDQYV